MSKKQIVYWANNSAPQNQIGQILLNHPPKKVSKQFFRQLAPEATYQRCPATVDFFSNMYQLEFPFDIDVKVTDNVAVGIGSQCFYPVRQHFENRITAELDLGFVFFSEEPLEIEMLPPFAEKTLASEYGLVALGGMDISSTFRPVVATHILWDGVNEFKAKENEPMFYIRFKTKNPIEFKHFYLTEKLFNVTTVVANWAHLYKWGSPLQFRYDRFKNSGMRDIVLKEIKENLI
jgi:hypothetical protein